MEHISKKRVVAGKPTTDLVFSAYVKNNEDIFPRILELYVKENASIADVTYGKGVFYETERIIKKMTKRFM